MTVDACSWARPVIPSRDVLVKPSVSWDAFIANLRAAQAVPLPGGATPPQNDPLAPLLSVLQGQGDILTIDTAVQIEALGRMYALYCPAALAPVDPDPTPAPALPVTPPP